MAVAVWVMAVFSVLVVLDLVELKFKRKKPPPFLM